MSDKLKVQNNGSYSLNFDKLDKTYVIHYTGDYLNGTSEVNFRTELTGYPENLAIKHIIITMAIY